MNIDWLEWAANGFNATSVVLAARNQIHTWWTGIIGCLLFGALFYENRLYADVVLQAFFVCTCIAGWIGWSERTRALPIGTTGPETLVRIVALSLVVTAGWGWLLHRFTDAYAPFPDSAILVGSVVAQFLLVRRRIETWFAWLLVDLIAVPLFASRGLWLTAVLYAAFGINALFGLRRWRMELQRQPAAAHG